MTANYYVKVETYNEEEVKRIKAAIETLHDIKNAIDKVDNTTSDCYPFTEMIDVLQSILRGEVL